MKQIVLLLTIGWLQLALGKNILPISIIGDIPAKNGLPISELNKDLHKDQVQSNFKQYGDMLVPESMIQEETTNSGNGDTNTTTRKIVVDRNLMWPDVDGTPTVPYETIPFGIRSYVLNGMKHWEEHTCIRFVSTVKQEPRLKFFVGDGCWSYVGRDPSSNGQQISIGVGCTSLGTVVHEIGHALGFWHEHMREDRDEHLYINRENIDQSQIHNFEKITNGVTSDMGVYYDLTSVMQYSSLGFSKNGKPTMSSLVLEHQGLMDSQHNGLSHRDKLLMNTAYNCLGKWLVSCLRPGNPCKNEGYIGSRCACVCPPGTRGEYCQETIATMYYYHDDIPYCNTELTSGTVFTIDHQLGSEETTCMLRITAPIGRVPKVTFTEFSVTNCYISACWDNYVQVRDKEVFNGNVFCGDGIKNGDKFIGAHNSMSVYLQLNSCGATQRIRIDVEDEPAPNAGYLLINQMSLTGGLLVVLLRVIS